MATPVSPPGQPARGPSQRGFHLPARQPYAREHERRAHEEVLTAYGEMTLFVLMWTLADFEAGRVERCSRCQVIASDDSNTNAEMIFETFKQPAEDRCPNCLGTTFEGGWKAKIVRPAIWDYSEERWDKNQRGYVTNLDARIQTGADFVLADRDYAFRADGTRWRAKGGTTDRIHDGFGTPSRVDSNLGYAYGTVVREDETSIAFDIEPKTRTELTNLLDVVGEHWPRDYSTVDQIRGPVLPEMTEWSPQEYRPVDEIPGPPDGEP
mgnify:CR=1 FL=1